MLAPDQVARHAEKEVAAAFVGFLRTLDLDRNSCSWHVGECSLAVIRKTYQEYYALSERERVRLMDKYLQRFYCHCILSDCPIAATYWKHCDAYTAQNPDQAFTCLLTRPAYRAKVIGWFDKYRYGEAAVIDQLKAMALAEFQELYQSQKIAVAQEQVKLLKSGAQNALPPELANKSMKLDLLFLRYHFQLDLLDKKATAPGYIATAWKAAVNALGLKKPGEAPDDLKFKNMPDSQFAFYSLNTASSGWFGGMFPSGTCGWLKLRLNAENSLYVPFNLHPSISEPIPPTALLDVRKAMQDNNIPLSAIMDICAALDKGIPESAYPNRALTTSRTQPYIKTLTPNFDPQVAMTVIQGFMS